MAKNSMPLPPAPEQSGAEESDDKKPAEMPPLPGEAKKAKVMPKAIKVVALRQGFFGQVRREAGDKFTVPEFANLGAWMQCEDPAIQKMHEENVAKKRAARKTVLAEE